MKEYNLQGKWNFLADLQKNGINQKYFKTAKYNDSMYLPGTVSEQKKVPKNYERNTGYLSDEYSCSGYIWFEKKINLKNCNKLQNFYTLKLERTRVSTIWINGEYVGTCNSLCSPHYYDITSYIDKTLRLTIMIDNSNYPTKGGHMTSPDTQTNWNGITGNICIIEENRNKLKDIKISSNLKNEIKKLSISFTLESESDKQVKLQTKNLFTKTINAKKGINQIEIDLPKNTIFWSDINPNLYELEISIPSVKNIYKISYGIRDFSAKENHFFINGKQTFLRGKHDGMIFPKTGYAPTDVESWIKVMETAKKYGINHYRFHTCCPPEAAFTAADILGIYLEPELPFWGTIQDENEEGCNKTEQEYLIEEGFNILKTFGNHPSFAMFSLGNELWGSSSRLDKILKGFKDFDNRHLYTMGSNNFQFCPVTTENEDFFVGVRFDKESLIRGSYAMCDAPQGFIQTEKPSANHDYSKFFIENTESSTTEENSEIEIQYETGVKKVKVQNDNQQSQFLPNKPVVTHEIGQYYMYPDYSDLSSYKGVLKPRNFEAFKERLINAGMKDYAKRFFRDSSALAVECYKQEFEACIKCNDISGFQVLDLQDFTGQGTAVVGILNSFMKSKGIIKEKEWRNFCNDIVLFASFDKFVFENNHTFSAQISLTNFSEETLQNKKIQISLINKMTKKTIYKDELIISDCIVGNKTIGNFTYQFESITEYSEYELYLEMKTNKTKISNHYSLCVYPTINSTMQDCLKTLQTQDESFIEVNGEKIVFTTNSSKAKDLTEKDFKVILLPSSIDKNIPGFESLQKIDTVQGTYCTDFWCYTMFKSISESMNRKIPIGTLGLTIDNKNKIFTKFKTETYTTPKWYNIVENSTCINLLGTEISPIVQMIDNVERNWKLGIVFETSYKSKKILVCTSQLQNLIDKPEVIYFAESLLSF